jgi:hypothetical protein
VAEGEGKDWKRRAETTHMSEQGQGPVSGEQQRTVWREVEGDAYSPHIFVNSAGGIGIEVGGRVIVQGIRQWHADAELISQCDPAAELARLRAIEAAAQRVCKTAEDDGAALEDQIAFILKLSSEISTLRAALAPERKESK